MSGCGSSRPVPAARREARVPNKQFAPRTLTGLLESPLDSARLGPQTRLGVPPTPPTDPKKARPPQSLLPNGKRSMAGLGHFRPCIPGGFTLPHCSDGTLGQGPRSEPRAPMQMVSAALGSLGSRVEGFFLGGRGGGVWVLAVRVRA